MGRRLGVLMTLSKYLRALPWSTMLSSWAHKMARLSYQPMIGQSVSTLLPVIPQTGLSLEKPQYLLDKIRFGNDLRALKIFSNTL